MLSLILWILGGLLLAVILYFVGVFVFMILGLKKLAHFAQGEIEELPKDYRNLRKHVKNENTSQGTEQFVKTIFVRWYEKWFK